MFNSIMDELIQMIRFQIPSKQVKCFEGSLQFIGLIKVSFLSNCYYYFFIFFNNIGLQQANSSLNNWVWSIPPEESRIYHCKALGHLGQLCYLYDERAFTQFPLKPVPVIYLHVETKQIRVIKHWQQP